MKMYGAIDLHSTNNVTVVIDEQDRVVYQKRLPNDLALILKELSVYQCELQGIVVESTYNWYWLVDGLMAEGYKVSPGQHSGDPTVRRTQVHRRSSRCALAGASVAIGSVARGLYLSQSRAAGARSAAQAKPDGAPENDESVEHSESVDPQHRQFAERQAGQEHSMSNRSTNCCLIRISPWRSRRTCR